MQPKKRKHPVMTTHAKMEGFTTMQPLSSLRRKHHIPLTTFEADLNTARMMFAAGNHSESIDVYEQLIAGYPKQAISILAELCDRYQSFPNRDRYSLYQSRFYNFGIKPSDKVLDVGSGHLPFPLATHLSDITFDDHSCGRAGLPFKPVDGKPMFECDLEHLFFDNKEFDFVYCSHVLEHTQNPEKACSEIMRIGKRGYIETPTKGKDIFLHIAKVSNHKWWIENVYDELIFTEYTQEEIEGIQSNVLLNMHTSPVSKREKAFSALLYLKADLFNTMLFWENEFLYSVRRNTSIHANYIDNNCKADSTQKKNYPAAHTTRANTQEQFGAGRRKQSTAHPVNPEKKQNNQSCDSFLLRGESLYNAGRINEAIDVFKEALRVQPESCTAYNNLGVSYWHLAKSEDSLECFQKALKIDPDDKHTILNFGNMLTATNNPIEAQKVYRTYLEHCPNDRQITDALVNLCKNILPQSGRH